MGIGSCNLCWVGPASDNLYILVSHKRSLQQLYFSLLSQSRTILEITERFKIIFPEHCPFPFPLEGFAVSKPCSAWQEVSFCSKLQNYSSSLLATSLLCGDWFAFANVQFLKTMKSSWWIDMQVITETKLPLCIFWQFEKEGRLRRTMDH